MQNVDILKHLITIKKCPKSTAMQFWSSFMTQLDGLLLRTWIIVLVYFVLFVNSMQRAKINLKLKLVG